MTNEQSKIDQKVRPLVLDAMAKQSGYEMARAFLYVQALREEPRDFWANRLSDDEFTDFLNRKILEHHESA